MGNILQERVNIEYCCTVGNTAKDPKFGPFKGFEISVVNKVAIFNSLVGSLREPYRLSL